jgi:hypothetical protein
MKILKLILGLITALMLIVFVFIWGYAPLRDERLEVRNAIMADFSAKAKSRLHSTRHSSQDHGTAR